MSGTNAGCTGRSFHSRSSDDVNSSTRPAPITRSSSRGVPSARRIRTRSSAAGSTLTEREKFAARSSSTPRSAGWRGIDLADRDARLRAPSADSCAAFGPSIGSVVRPARAWARRPRRRGRRFRHNPAARSLARRRASRRRSRRRSCSRSAAGRRAALVRTSAVNASVVSVSSAALVNKRAAALRVRRHDQHLARLRALDRRDSGGRRAARSSAGASATSTRFEPLASSSAAKRRLRAAAGRNLDGLLADRAAVLRQRQRARDGVRREAAHARRRARRSAPRRRSCRPSNSRPRRP